MKKVILIDFEKIADPFCGLGQFCSHLKNEFDKSSLNLKYWIPTGLMKSTRILSFLLPHCDLFHATNQDSRYIPWNKKTKFIYTVHDLNYFSQNKNPRRVQKYKKRFQSRLDRADFVTFISEFARQDILAHFVLDIKKTQVIYNGVALGEKSEQPKIIPEGKFIFSIGTVVPKKNFHVLINMMTLLPEYKLVIAGTINNPYAQDMIQKIKELKLENQIYLVGPISEPNKIWYYQHSVAFIFPSLLEGFGLPIVEAMSFGLPLFLSDKTSIPEIGGPDAYYFNNFEASNMAQIFQDGMNDFNELKKERLISRSSKFSWKNAVKDYEELYLKLLN